MLAGMRAVLNVTHVQCGCMQTFYFQLEPEGECDWAAAGCVDSEVYDQKNQLSCAAYTAYEVLNMRVAKLNGHLEPMLACQEALDCLHGKRSPPGGRQAVNYFE